MYGKSILACLGKDGGEAIGGKILELVDVEVKISALVFGYIGTRYRSQCKARDQQRPDQVGVLFTDLSFGEVGDEDAAGIHERARIEAALFLAEDVARHRRHQELLDPSQGA